MKKKRKKYRRKRMAGADFNTPGTEQTGPADNVTIIDALT
jgi:hypothetical protein